MNHPSQQATIPPSSTSTANLGGRGTTSKLARARGHLRVARSRRTSTSNPKELDWSMLARPRPDGFDGDVSLDVAGRIWRRAYPAPAIIAGDVAVRESTSTLLADEQWSEAPLSHSHIDQAVALLRLWPSGFRQFGQLIDVFHPVFAGSAAQRTRMHLEHQRGHFWADISDPLRLSYAFVREMAHTKLLDLGLHYQCDHHLVLNPRACHFDIVSVDGITCGTMAAVLHELVASCYQLTLAQELLAIGMTGDMAIRVRTDRKAELEINHALTERVLGHAELDGCGRVFLDAVLAWREGLKQEAAPS